MGTKCAGMPQFLIHRTHSIQARSPQNLVHSGVWTQTEDGRNDCRTLPLLLAHILIPPEMHSEPQILESIDRDDSQRIQCGVEEKSGMVVDTGATLPDDENAHAHSRSRGNSENEKFVIVTSSNDRDVQPVDVDGSEKTSRYMNRRGSSNLVNMVPKSTMSNTGKEEVADETDDPHVDWLKFAAARSRNAMCCWNAQVG